MTNTDGLRKSEEWNPGVLPGQINVMQIRQLIHELHVHQIELEMQNEELRRERHSPRSPGNHRERLYDSAPLGCLILDENGTIHDINPTASILLGEKRARILQSRLSFFRFVSPRDLFRFQAHLKDGCRTCSRHSCELELVRKGGAPFYAQLTSLPEKGGDGSPSRIRIAISDITSLKQAQDALEQSRRELEDQVQDRTINLAETNRALKRSEERYRALFENNPIRTVIVDRDGRVTGYNRARASTGRDLEIGGLMYKDYAAAHEIDMRAELMDCIRRGISKEYPELRYRDEYLYVKMSPFPEGAIITCVNVTKRKLAEERLRERTAELAASNAELQRRSEQLARLSSEMTLSEERERRRLAMVIHDHLQQLLVAAQIRLGSLTRRLGKDHRKEAEGVQELIRESIQASRSLTAELSPPVLYEQGLAAALEWLAQWMNQKYGLEVTLEMDPRAAPGQHDLMVLLYQSVRELLFNVVKHARVDAAHVRMSRRDDCLKIIVRDQGVGFDPERLGKNPDETEEFGLFSIRERLELLRGRLEVESAPGKGAAFSLVLPLSETESAEQGAESLVTHENRTARADAPDAFAENVEKIRVLLVDDHRMIRQGISSMLLGHADIEVVSEASDGEEAVEMARRLKPDVILMDVNMPKINGTEATRMIHSESPSIRIIGLSMYKGADIASAMFDAGAVAYLSKDGEPDDLLAAIRGRD